MSEFQPYYTADGSIGLYNSDVDDIYHSATGALTEAYEKFIYPIDFESLLKNEEIKVLDVCYGIGYNTKSFLNFLLENFSPKNCPDKHNIAPIHTDNITTIKEQLCTESIHTYNAQNLKGKPTYSETVHTDNVTAFVSNSTYCGTIHADNIFNKISITAIDNDKILANLSPFIKTELKIVKGQKLNFKHKGISKFLSKNNKTNLKIDKLINFLILSKIFYSISTNTESQAIVFSKKFSQYFDSDLQGIFRAFLNQHGKFTHKSALLSNLHNIYYRYIANRYKNRLKALKLQEVNFELKIDDARNFIKDSQAMYNLIFLDAFSPNKCPCLWSYEFFTELFKHLEPDGMLLTYSTSASVRSAMVEAGFYIGNIYNKRLEKITGTIAVKNPKLIKHHLSEFDFGLLKTRAGIFYRDENLKGQNEAIIAARNLEVKNSNKISSTQYKKFSVNTCQML